MIFLSDSARREYCETFNTHQLFLNEEEKSKEEKEKKDLRSHPDPTLTIFRLIATTGFLDIQSILSLMQLNKRMYKICNSNPLWKNLFFNYASYPRITRDFSCPAWKSLLKKIKLEDHFTTRKAYQVTPITSASATIPLLHKNKESIIFRNNQIITILSQKTGKILLSIKEADKEITSAYFHKNKKLITGDESGTFSIFNLENTHLESSEKIHLTSINKIISFSQLFFSISKNQIYICSENGKFLFSYLHSDSIWKIRHSTNLMISATKTGEIFLLTINPKGPRFSLHSVDLSSPELSALKLYPEKDLLITGSLDGKITFFTMTPPYSKKVIKINSSKITSLVRLGSTLFASIGEGESEIICLDLLTTEILFSLKSPTNISYLKPIGSGLVSLSTEGDLIFWDLKQKKIIQQIKTSLQIQKILTLSNSILLLLKNNSLVSLKPTSLPPTSLTPSNLTNLLIPFIPLTPSNKKITRKRKREEDELF